MRDDFVKMNLARVKEVQQDEMSRRTNVTKIRRKRKKTRKIEMKVRKQVVESFKWYFTYCDALFFLTFPETIKVFDGNCSLRRRIFRAITVPRSSTLEQLLTTALRAFHIARDPNVSIQLNDDIFWRLSKIAILIFIAILSDGSLCNKRRWYSNSRSNTSFEFTQDRGKATCHFLKISVRLWWYLDKDMKNTNKSPLII